jgi:hypothetical protein
MRGALFYSPDSTKFTVTRVFTSTGWPGIWTVTPLSDGVHRGSCQQGMTADQLQIFDRALPADHRPQHNRTQNVGLQGQRQKGRLQDEYGCLPS